MQRLNVLARFVRRRCLTFSAPNGLDLTNLDPTARAAAVLVWQRRHANERASVVLAERMERHARELTPGPTVDALARLAADEARHVDATGAVLDALRAPRVAAARIRTPDASEPAELSFARDVIVGLALCESVSAARFAAVRAATDLPTFRRMIDGFLRDEIAHAGLGFELLPSARALVSRRVGAAACDKWMTGELMGALVELERTIGLDGARRGLLPPRRQPSANPGVIEPNLDALAFYDAITRRFVPRVERFGLPLRAAWEARFARASAPTPER